MVFGSEWTQLWTQVPLRRLLDIPLRSLATGLGTHWKRTHDQVLHARVELSSASGEEGALPERYGLPLILLMVVAGIVFLAGCVNLSNLQLARLSSRQWEIAIRISLGATRLLVLGQVVIEDLLLASIAGLLALATGREATSLLLRWASGREGLVPLESTFRYLSLSAGIHPTDRRLNRVQSFCRHGAVTPGIYLDLHRFQRKLVSGGQDVTSALRPACDSTSQPDKDEGLVTDHYRFLHACHSIAMSSGLQPLLLSSSS
jgi:hypothetical protein